jgi:hypothetical protein
MADDELRDLPLTPMTRVQFEPIGGALYMLLVDGEAVGDFSLAPEQSAWFFQLPTAKAYGEHLEQMKLFFESQGVTL